MTDNKFEVGEKVMLVRGYGRNCSYTPAVVARAYKNGRFKLAGNDTRQYRPDGRPAGARDRGLALREYVEKITPELLARVGHYQARETSLTEVENLRLMIYEMARRVCASEDTAGIDAATVAVRAAKAELQKVMVAS